MTDLPDLEPHFPDKKEAFHLPKGLIYLNGNSLGVLPKHVSSHVSKVVQEEWGNRLIRGWNDHSWIDLPQRTGHRLAKLIGAVEGSLIACDSTSINLFKVLCAALTLRPERSVILSDIGNFPTDLYIAQGLSEGLWPNCQLKLVTPEEVENALDETVAAVMLTQVDYKTGRLHDMAQITSRAHAVGALAIWDLAHSAGALPIDVTSAKVDFAVGCGYKYLNGGPGAPGFLYIAPNHQEGAQSPILGWMGHKSPFDFDLEFTPALGVDKMSVGTPPILSLSSLFSALEVFEGVDMVSIRHQSIALTELFISELEKHCPQLKLVSPRNAVHRGSHVSFEFDQGYALVQALISKGVIGDFRAPNIIRFGFAPLYVSCDDVLQAVEILKQILDGGEWDRPEFKRRAKVT